jgi:hypothetical protein
MAAIFFPKSVRKSKDQAFVGAAMAAIFFSMSVRRSKDRGHGRSHGSEKIAAMAAPTGAKRSRPWPLPRGVDRNHEPRTVSVHVLFIFRLSFLRGKGRVA